MPTDPKISIYHFCQMNCCCSPDDNDNCWIECFCLRDKMHWRLSVRSCSRFFTLPRVLPPGLVSWRCASFATDITFLRPIPSHRFIFFGGFCSVSFHIIDDCCPRLACRILSFGCSKREGRRLSDIQRFDIKALTGSSVVRDARIWSRSTSLTPEMATAGKSAHT